MPVELREVTLDDLDQVVEARLAHALPRELGLLAGDRRAGDAAAVLAGGVDREAAPAAADLEQVIARRQLQVAADPVELLGLRLFQRCRPER